jgi:hypothetical protein
MVNILSKPLNLQQQYRRVSDTFLVKGKWQMKGRKRIESEKSFYIIAFSILYHEDGFLALLWAIEGGG